MNELVKFQKNNGEISEEVCELLEINDNICRIKRNSGEIIKIFIDRIKYINEIISNQVVEQIDGERFNPWSINANAEVWVKSSNFSDVIICETYAIIVGDLYISHNIYNGISKSKSEYKISDLDKLYNKLIKKGYKKLENEYNRLT